MSNLKELRTRIEAIQSTQKITSAMKMVAASRLRRVQILVDKNQEYAENLRKSALRVLTEIEQEEKEKNIKYIRPLLLHNRKNTQKYELYVFSSDRGLCGAYNTNIAKKASERLSNLLEQNKKIKVFCSGKKAYDILKRTFTNVEISLIDSIDGNISYPEAAEKLAKYILDRFSNKEFDVCEIVYSDFLTTINRNFVCEQVCPLELKLFDEDITNINQFEGAYYEYLPDKNTILEQITPILFVDKIFQILVNSVAAEHSARMTSMDNATRNAKKIINELKLKYNSLRQAAITNELIEIISGADAV